MLEKEIEFQISFWRHYIFHDWLKTTKNFFFEKSEHYLHGVWELKLPSRLLLIAQRRVSIGGRALRQQRVVSLFCLVSSFILSFVLWYSLSVCYIPYSYAFFFFFGKGGRVLLYSFKIRCVSNVDMLYKESPAYFIS